MSQKKPSPGQTSLPKLTKPATTEKDFNVLNKNIMKSILIKTFIILAIINFAGCSMESLVLDLKQDNSLDVVGDFAMSIGDYNVEEPIEEIIKYLTEIANLHDVTISHQLLYSEDEVEHFRISLSFDNQYKIASFIESFKNNNLEEDLGIPSMLDFTLTPRQDFTNETEWNVKLSLISETPIHKVENSGKYKKGTILFNMPGVIKSWEPKNDNKNCEVIRKDQNSLIYSIDTLFAFSGSYPPIDIQITSSEAKAKEPPINPEKNRARITKIDNSQRNKIDNSQKTEIKNIYPSASIQPEKKSDSGEIEKKTRLTARIHC